MRGAVTVCVGETTAHLVGQEVSERLPVADGPPCGTQEMEALAPQPHDLLLRAARRRPSARAREHPGQPCCVLCAWVSVTVSATTTTSAKANLHQAALNHLLTTQVDPAHECHPRVRQKDAAHVDAVWYGRESIDPRRTYGPVVRVSGRA